MILIHSSKSNNHTTEDKPFWHWRRRQCFLENAWLLLLWDRSESISRVQSNTASGGPANWIRRIKKHTHARCNMYCGWDEKELTTSKCCRSWNFSIVLVIFLSTKPTESQGTEFNENRHMSCKTPYEMRNGNAKLYALHKIFDSQHYHGCPYHK